MWVLQWLMQGVAIAVVATAVVRLVPPTSPRLRHRFWWLALAAVMAVPWVPALPEPVATLATVAPLVPSPHALAWEVTAPPAWLWTACLMMWTGSATVGLLRLLADLHALRRMKRSARPLRCPGSHRVDELRATAAALRGTQLVVSDDLAGACAAGFFAPRVIVSSRLASSLEPAALESIVRHELAHLERFDDWLGLLQRLVLAVAGLHPAVRWISRQIDTEREAACDRRVVEQTGDPHRYARALTTVAELMAGVGRSPRMAPGAVMAGAGLHARVVRLLCGKSEPSPGRVRVTAVVTLTTLALAVAGVAALPPLVVIGSRDAPVEALGRLVAGPLPMRHVPEPTIVGPRPRMALQARAVRTSVTAGLPVALQAAPVQHEHAPGEAADSRDTELAATRVELQDAPVAVDTLDVPARREVRIDMTLPDGTSSSLTDAIGVRASRVGRATGSTAARAGSAIGRFFSKSGLSVAERF